MTPAARRPVSPLHTRIDALLSKLLGRTPGSAGDGLRTGPDDESPLGPGATELALAHYAHDMRNQLAMIAASADVLASLAPGPDAEREFLALRHGVERASALTREMLRAPSPSEPADYTDLNTVVEASAGTVARLSGPQIRVELDLAPEPVVVGAKRADLERILVNLALNAREAMGYQGMLRIATALIVQASGHEPGVVRTTQRARLVVADTGCGMRPEVRARIFEPFFTTKPDGTGMGLSSVAATVRQLKGMLTVESQPGRGTSIEVHLPGACPR